MNASTIFEDDSFKKSNFEVFNNDSASNFNNIISNVNITDKTTTSKKKKPIFATHCKWNKDEDRKLIFLISIFGVNDWRNLAKKMDGRNSRQCRDRWQYYLNPNINHNDWTKEEDQLIIKMREKYGPKWVLISKYFKNRTDAMIEHLIRTEKQKNENKHINSCSDLSSNLNKELFLKNNNQDNKCDQFSPQLQFETLFDLDTNFLSNTETFDDDIYQNENLLFDIDNFTY